MPAASALMPMSSYVDTLGECSESDIWGEGRLDPKTLPTSSKVFFDLFPMVIKSFSVDMFIQGIALREAYAFWLSSFLFQSPLEMQPMNLLHRDKKFKREVKFFLTIALSVWNHSVWGYRTIVYWTIDYWTAIWGYRISDYGPKLLDCQILDLKNYRLPHRVYRVLGFFSSRPN